VVWTGLHPSLDSVFFVSRPEPGPREPHPPAYDWRHVARRINDQRSRGAWTCALAARPASRAGGRRRRRHCGPKSPRYPGRSVDLTGRDHRLGQGPCRRCPPRVRSSRQRQNGAGAGEPAPGLEPETARLQRGCDCVGRVDLRDLRVLPNQHRVPAPPCNANTTTPSPRNRPADSTCSISYSPPATGTRHNPAASHHRARRDTRAAYRRRQPRRPQGDRQPLQAAHTPSGSATHASDCTPSPASPLKPANSSPTPSTTPATNNSHETRSANSQPVRRHSRTPTTRSRPDQLDGDHPHDAEMSASAGAAAFLAEVDADHSNATGSPPGCRVGHGRGPVMVPACGGGRRPAARVTARMWQ
jgi:hypothetical protein